MSKKQKKRDPVLDLIDHLEAATELLRKMSINSTIPKTSIFESTDYEMISYRISLMTRELVKAVNRGGVA